MSENPKHQTIFTDIKYKNAVHDIGMIIAERRGRWELKKWRKPAWAKNLTAGEFCSEISPHKKNITIYIPKGSIQVKDEVLIFVNGKFTKILVTKKHGKTFAFEVLETRMITKITTHKVEKSIKFGEA